VVVGEGRKGRGSGLFSAHVLFMTFMIRASSKALPRLTRFYSTDIKLPGSSNSNTAEASSSSSVNSSSSISLSRHPHAEAEAYVQLNQNQQSNGTTTLPSPPKSTHPKPSAVFSNMHPPFHTHNFVIALEKSFPATIARTLMRATRAMLIHKVGYTRRESLDKKDMENVSIISHLS
jgi:hypothetical protein